MLKRNSSYGGTYSPKAGLLNSAHFLEEGLEHYLSIKSKLVTVIDGNGVDREIYQYKPSHCILEAIWVTPTKLEELVRLHPKVKFIIRIHSKIPFLSNEGVAIEWIKKYFKIKNTTVSFNNLETSEDFNRIGVKNVFLPNLYKVEYKERNLFEKMFSFKKHEPHQKVSINIGCFGAIRPLKNQLIQAVAAISFAEKHNKVLFFHINSSRVEQKGEETLKNIRNLFKNTKHALIEHKWLTHDSFLKVIGNLDIGMQVSFTESFNIVTADYISQRIPVVVSKDIDWVHPISNVDPNETLEMISRLETVLFYKKFVTEANLEALYNYNRKSVKMWEHYFKKELCF